jgi:hypothetical protein
LVRQRLLSSSEGDSDSAAEGEFLDADEVGAEEIGGELPREEEEEEEDVFGGLPRQKVMYEGREYDYVFDVSTSPDAPPLKLPYNRRRTLCSSSFMSCRDRLVTKAVGAADRCRESVSSGDRVPAEAQASARRVPPAEGGLLHHGADSGTEPPDAVQDPRLAAVVALSLHSCRTFAAGSRVALDGAERTRTGGG